MNDIAISTVGVKMQTTRKKESRFWVTHCEYATNIKAESVSLPSEFDPLNFIYQVLHNLHALPLLNQHQLASEHLFPSPLIKNFVQ